MSARADETSAKTDAEPASDDFVDHRNVTSLPLLRRRTTSKDRPMKNRAIALSLLSSVLVACAVGSNVSEDPETSLESQRDLPSTSATASTDASADARRKETGNDDAAAPNVPDAGSNPAPDASSPTLSDAGSTGTDGGSTGTDASVLVQDASTTDASTGSAPRFGAGEILITEVQFDPSGAEPDGEWIEVLSLATSPRTLKGLTLRDGAGRSRLVADDVVLTPGAYTVLARSRTAARTQGVPDTAIAYEYGTGESSSAGVILANGSTGSVAILTGTQELVRVPYGSFSIAGNGSGKSYELRGTAFSQVLQTSAQFCVSERSYGASGGFGTPGAASSCL